MIWQKSKKQKYINVKKGMKKICTVGLKISSFVGNPVAVI